MPIIQKKGKEDKAMELDGRIVLQNKGIIQIPETACKIVLNKENFSLFPEGKGTYLFSYREALNVTAEDYKLILFLSGEQELQISQLGYQYEDFVRTFIKLRNETLLKDLLFQETLKKSGFKAVFVSLDNSGVEKQKGSAEFKFYQTSLVILPEKGELIRVPYSDILETKTDNFQVEFKTEGGGNIIVSMLGDKFDLFKETLQNCLNEIVLNVQNFIKGLFPEIDFSTLNKLSELIKEGKAVSKKDIEAVSSEFSTRLEENLMKTEVKEEYQFLKSMGEQEQIHLGFKKGLMGGLTGDYLWFLIPIYSQDKTKPGNVIAFETAGEKETGRATYFFRILGREEYKNASKEQIDSQIDDLISKINRGLSAINFRREPIYLPEEKLNEPEYVKYKFSIAKIPEIKSMRSLFIGRVSHRDDTQWQKDVADLLTFNINSTNDGEKWAVPIVIESGIIEKKDTNASASAPKDKTTEMN
ncbi:MAG: hypothetical protein NTX26_01435 [Candidatus Parcubacteria bacterium]|nr:hypothetical protein [Candidatus Parcubacteria bacterium]